MNWIRVKEYFQKIQTFLTEGNTPVKLFFLALSVFLWFLIKLSNEGYSAMVELPVRYQNLGETRTFGTLPQSKVQLQITAQGFNILKHKLQSFGSIKVDVSKVERKINKQYSYWATNADLHFVESQLGADVKLRSIYPDTIYFDFTRLIQKKVAVKINTENNFSKDISIYGKPVLKPDSILITGPASIVGSMHEIETELLSLNGEEEFRKENLDLILPKEKSLKFSQDEVEAIMIGRAHV